MKTYIGEEGLTKTWQEDFPKETKCVHCDGDARIGFVYFEDGHKGEKGEYVCQLHDNHGGDGGDYWLHDCCAVAVYFCKNCLKPTALYNQA